MPRRLANPGAPGFTVYVGGLPRDSISDLPGLVGCVRGLRVGDTPVAMAETARAFPGKTF